MAALWNCDRGIVTKDLHLPIRPRLQIVYSTLGFQQGHESIGEHVRVRVNYCHFRVAPAVAAIRFYQTALVLDVARAPCSICAPTSSSARISLRIRQKTEAGREVIGDSEAPVSWIKVAFPVDFSASCRPLLCEI